MTHRIFNFNPGPATLPLPVLERAREEMLNYSNTGMSVMEISHRSKEYSEIHTTAGTLLRELMNIPKNYKVLFLQGGASLQFVMAPLNLLLEGRSADYIITGSWSKKALKEAKGIGSIRIAGSTEETNFDRIPSQSEINLDSTAVYAHITSNNTIAGTQWSQFPDTGDVPLVSDMSSDILSRKINVNPFGIIYAGAQKNLGPAGVTVVIIREDLIERSREDIPILLRYTTHAEKDSLYHTPPAYAVYIMKMVLEWVKDQGGLEAIEKANQKKGEILYNTIDQHSDFYRGAVEKGSRSLMNATFRLPNEELESKFISEGLSSGFGGLKGHRTVGGVRVSMYNAMPVEGIQNLADFMNEFVRKNG